MMKRPMIRNCVGRMMLGLLAWVWIFPLSGAESTEAPGFSAVFLSDERIAALRELLASKEEPTWSAFGACLAEARRNLDRVPQVPRDWYVPGYYRDAEGHRKAKGGLRDDANAAYALALCYRLTGEKDFARAAIRLLNAWSGGVEKMSREDDSTLSFCYHFPAMIIAADFLRDEGVWPEEEEAVFARFLREQALPMSTMGRENNWGNWGLVLSVSAAAYLRDEALFAKCVERWKFFIEHQIAPDGHMPHEVRRVEGKRGIWYSHFALMPQTIAGEILKVNGADLFAYQSPSGRNLRSAYEKVAGWTRHPAGFPYWDGPPEDQLGVRYFSYFEILHTLWPDENAAALLKGARPLSADHVTPFLTLTHGRDLSGGGTEKR
ncbi:MAG: alginate lyase family protein [Verrucomicrobiales bacterium]